MIQHLRTTYTQLISVMQCLRTGESLDGFLYITVSSCWRTFLQHVSGFNVSKITHSLSK